uniref:NADH-ubiquinone oxidoreductase chain 2 n=1 Tax=Rhagovelia reitteri TaxID=2581066 RepID=A0A5B9XWY0_9HEMI|nr:NADH dehydrogenase subunit 2 [Rhagovelia reitteri]QEH58861.1 NADH dehydrogenase subunit 2 [Rhagovelia reitteri]
MFKNSTKMMIFTTLILSTMLIISSENWMSLWMGLEINMLSFIPLIEEKKNNYSAQSKMMYFLIQSMSSMLFLFMIIMNPTIIFKEMIIENTPMIIMSLAMMMKLGMAPMHMWFVNMMKKMNWMNCLILMTWQKIGPLYIMTNMNLNSNIIKIMAILSTVIGAIGGIQQTSIKSIMAFSSINHMGWLIMCMKYNYEMWMKYLIIYSIIIFMMTMIFEKMTINFLNQMNSNIKTNIEKMNMMMLFMSLGGLPPFIGFLPKWMVLQSIMKNNMILPTMIMIMSSMVTLFFYMRMMSPIILMNNIMNKWNKTNYKNNKINMMMMMINMTLPLTMIMKIM